MALLFFLLFISAAVTSGQALALSIAGAISTALAWLANNGIFPASWNWTDSQGRLHGRPALFVALFISVVVSFIALWITGDPDLHALVNGSSQYSAGKLYTVGWAVFGIATIVFKVIYPGKERS